ncbi:amino acid adenylation domain-containing protein [Phenylobacterium deserti]|uniref:amino acid adenylation domain-containing protein n=1 Tax=Phenylobacterium deserti TaxID=1914756 RepID=UPI001057A2ED|nr:amino acid adenylation domain-containing protein [Phenylobacterium deserti]
MSLDLLAVEQPASDSAGVRLDVLFSQQARRTPRALAVLHRGTQLSYADLEAQADGIAKQLAAMGAGPGVLVGVCMRRTPRMLAGLLGVLKSGAAYLPLDPAYPDERLAFMLDDSAAALLLTDCALDRRLDFQGGVLDLSADVPQVRGPGMVRGVAGPSDLAYVIYTSGSTGRPKGVMLGHTAAGLVDWARKTFTRGEMARMAATTSICFDPSILEIFAPLCTGAAVVLKESALEPFTPDEQPTMLDGVPSAVAELCRAGALPDSVRVVNVGGEPLKAALVREIYARTRVEAVYNHYGPTEATTCATVALARRDQVDDPPIGRAIAGAKLHLLDAAGQPVKAGETGEIHIGGPSLAIGYLNQPELTAARFVQSRWGRLYRTGDLGRWTAASDLEFLGRIDDQVKIRGFRVEIGEVESALVRLPQVTDAAVLARPDAQGRTQLVAYLQSERPWSVAEVRAALKAWLPDHMLPARLVVLDAFPLTLSGKVDRNALPAPQEPGGAAPVNVESRIEEAIAEVFKDVLGRAQVERDDSFFDLGGDSLSGVTAALRLEEILGYELPSALLHQAPSPRELAQALEQCPVHRPQHLSVLQAGGDGAPLFCLADLFARPFSYLSLSRRLAADRPVLGLSPGPLEGAFATSGSIPDLTAAFLAELRRVQPAGPYLLAGYSAGGVLAFDLAGALEREGEVVSLVLLDSSMRSSRPSAGQLVRWAMRQGLDLMHPAAFRARYERMGGLREKLARALAQRETSPLPEWIPEGQGAVAARLMAACATYRPGTFRGRTLLLKSTDRDRIDALLDHDGLLGWGGALKGPVTTEWVSGDHHAFMREPRVSEAAAHIEAFLAGHG